MSKTDINNDFSTKLRNETFIHFADNSSMGVAIIQRGYLQYFNQKFVEIFKYTKEDILRWEKREFYKIVHPEDLPSLIKNFSVEDDKKTVSVRFRGITKDKDIINIENYICHIYYNNTTAYLSSYVPLEETYKEEVSLKPIKITSKKKIILEFDSKTIKLLEENNIKFDIYDFCSYREEF